MVIESGQPRVATPIRWLLSLGIKFFRVVPVHTTVVTGVSLASRVAVLLAFLLPLKVIILLGSDRVPRYFPEFLTDIPRDTLIPLLAGAAVGFYLLHLLADRVSQHIVDQGAAILMSRSRKIVLFENQDRVAQLAYRRFVDVVASMTFFVAALAGLMFIYPWLAFWLSLLIVAATFVLRFLYARVKSFQKPDRVSGSVKLLGDVGFLFAFSLMIVDYLHGTSPNVLISILSLILVRQLIQRCSAAFSNGWTLIGQRLQLAALFFHGHSLALPQPSSHSDYWPLLFRPLRDEWVASLLAQHGSEGSGLTDCQWHQTGTPGVASLVARTSSRGAGARSYLVRIFNDQSSALAQHEATILGCRSATDLPAPVLLAVDDVEGFHCHVYAWEGYRGAPAGNLGEKIRELTARLMTVELPKGLVDQYLRSRPVLWQRIDQTVLDRLRVAVNADEDRWALTSLYEALGDIQHRLRGMPLQLRNPGQNRGTLFLDENDRVVSIQWTRWALDPVGSGWPVAERQLQKLPEVIDEAGVYRSALRTVTSDQVSLAALVFEFERLYQAQLYTDAIGAIPRILAALGSISHNSTVERAGVV
jgi:hypothetical protein